MKVNRYFNDMFVVFKYEFLAFILVIACCFLIILIFGHLYDNFLTPIVLFFIMVTWVIYFVFNFIETNKGLSELENINEN